MHIPALSLLLHLLPLTAAVLIIETSTSTYTAAITAAASSSSSSSSTPSSSSTTTTTTSPSTPTSASPQYTSTPLFTTSILNSTNTYRTLYNATSLTWNTSLATYATAYSSKCQFSHSNGSPGENLAEGYANVTEAVDAWGEEGKHYDWNNGGGFSESTGHFSQLVWKGTETVGCGRTECDGRGGVGGWLVVCEYWPAGNVEGEFGEEVGREVRKWESEGGGKAGEWLARVVAKGSAGGRKGGRGLGLWVWGLGMLVVMGV